MYLKVPTIQTINFHHNFITINQTTKSNDKEIRNYNNGFNELRVNYEPVRKY